MAALDQILRRYGGEPDSLIPIDCDGPALLPYATITAARSAEDSDLAPLIGVYEWHDRTLFFLVDGASVAINADQLARIRRVLAMRGDTPYHVVVDAVRLTVYDISLDGPAESARLALGDLGIDEQIVIPHLGNIRPRLSASRRWIGEVVLRLLTGALDDLDRLGVAGGDAISLVGRALFLRFLADREMLPLAVTALANGDAAALFDEPASAVAASAWLDATFNGDFLPLASETIGSLPSDAFRILGSILRRATGNQLHIGWHEKWDQLDFAHIPVGVLSQAYERYLSHRDPETQRNEGGYYTPRHIADLMVRAAFGALAREGETHGVKVLDPSAGAGVFLLTAFRQLVAERWRSDGSRPDTKILREILYGQITGFDINEAALRFAALGLYLISIELDPNPEPIEKLRFDDLRPNVLRNVGSLTAGPDDDPEQPKGLGSLGDTVGAEHEGRYDLVIGNPPWATATRLANWSNLQERVRRLARQRSGEPALAAPIPNEVLDLPFVWRAMEWARPGGQIAFALHARLLFQRGETMPDARNALLASLDVTGIVNGTELRRTRVWPEITAPFCILFARNTAPPPGAGFRFTSPHLEGPLNASGDWRVDAANAEVLPNRDVRARPELLKILFRGSRLDLELYDRIASKGLPTLRDYWAELFGAEKGRPRNMGNGYQRLRKSSRIRKGEEEPGASAAYLHHLPELPKGADLSLLLDVSPFDRFSANRIHDPRPISLFTGPLLLVAESPPVRHGRIKATISLGDVVFNQSFHGYSTHNHPDDSDLAKYLSLILCSRIALWHALITSGRFGFEREVVEKFVLDEIPLPRFECLGSQDRLHLSRLFDTLAQRETDAGWAAVDLWVAKLYGLDADDLAVIEDTLRFRLPFAANVKAAQEPATHLELGGFVDRLARDLGPWGIRYGREFTVKILETPLLSPWRFVALELAGSLQSGNLAWTEVIAAADQLSATEIIYASQDANRLVVGRLNQARYWSESQARLVARRLVWDHMPFLSGTTPR